MLAIVPMGEAQEWAANRVNEMVQILLPVVSLPADEVRRRLQGLRPHDA